MSRKQTYRLGSLLTVLPGFHHHRTVLDRGHVIGFIDEDVLANTSDAPKLPSCAYLTEEDLKCYEHFGVFVRFDRM